MYPFYTIVYNFSFPTCHCRKFPLTDLLKDTVKKEEYPRINSLYSAVETLKYIMAASAQPPSDARPRLARAARCPPPSARTSHARVNQSDQRGTFSLVSIDLIMLIAASYQ